MKAFSREHKQIAAFLGIGLIGCVAVYILVLRPIRIKVADDSAMISRKRSELTSRNWPLEPDRLRAILERNLKKLNGTGDTAAQNARDASGLRRKSELVLKECTGTLIPRIKKIFQNPSDFFNGVTRLDYEEEFLEFESQLASRGIFLSEDVFGISSKTDSPHIAEMLLQIWTVDEITDIAFKNGIFIAREKGVFTVDDRGKRRPVSRIRLLEPRRFKLQEKGSVYVTEFPVRLTLIADSQRLSAMFKHLQQGDTFLPVNRMQINVMPRLLEQEDKIQIDSRTLMVEIECSSFFRDPGDMPSSIQPEKKEIIPVGA